MWLLRLTVEKNYRKYFAVGYYQPDGEFYVYEDYLSPGEAERLCAYLNGGNGKYLYHCDRH